MDIAIGQDEYKRAQQRAGGEDEFIPVGWEKLIDSGIYLLSVQLIKSHVTSSCRYRSA
jgi:hypothetical protein